MSANIISNFNLHTNLPLDSRYVVDTIEEMNAVPEHLRYLGMPIYVKETKLIYFLKDGLENDNWHIATFEGTEAIYRLIIGEGTPEDSDSLFVIGNDINGVMTSVLNFNKQTNNLELAEDIILFKNDPDKRITLSEYIVKLLRANAALVYCGILDIDPSLNSPGNLTPAGTIGDTYVASKSGYLNGEKIEVGDMIICNTTADAATSTNYKEIMKSWNIVQTNIDIMVGATSSTAGNAGMVPTPMIGDDGKFLKGDGAWQTIQISDIENMNQELQDIKDECANINNIKTTEWIVTAHSTDGEHYTATLDPAPDDLYVGMEITIIPDKISVATIPELDVNDMGPYQIRRSTSRFSGNAVQYTRTNALSVNRPIKLMFNGSYWVDNGRTKPYWDDIGNLPAKFNPDYHAIDDVDNVYGIGADDVHGHVKLSDAMDEKKDVLDGTAATPYAVQRTNERIDETNTVKKNEWCEIATSDDGKNYVMTLDPAPEALYKGMIVTMIPNTGSSTSIPTLNVNDLGAKEIRRYSGKYTNGVSAGLQHRLSLIANFPVLLQYNGVSWIDISRTRPEWDDIANKPTEFNPSSHATSTDDYGIGDLRYYGHVMLTDNLNDATHGQWDGVASTPYAVSELNRIKSNEWVATTTGEGNLYEVELDPLPESLYNGMSITIIPHTISTSSAPSLAVKLANGTVATRVIKRKLGSYTGWVDNLYSANSLYAGHPVRLQFSTYTDCWILMDDIKISWDDLKDKPTSFTPSNHASSSSAYGLGTNIYYGHVKLSDSLTTSSNINNGVAATPYAVKQLNDKINSMGGGIPIINVSPSDSCTFSGNSSAITNLYPGLQIIIIPTSDLTHGDTTFKLNINNLGSKYIYFAGTSSSDDWNAVPTSSSIISSTPVRLMYNGEFWVAGDLTIPNWGDIVNRPSSFTPSSHATSSTTYGLGSASYYGHVKLSDSCLSSSGASGGIAATPYAVNLINPYDVATTSGSVSLGSVSSHILVKNSSTIININSIAEGKTCVIESSKLDNVIKLDGYNSRANIRIVVKNATVVMDYWHCRLNGTGSTCVFENCKIIDQSTYCLGIESYNFEISNCSIEMDDYGYNIDYYTCSSGFYAYNNFLCTNSHIHLKNTFNSNGYDVNFLYHCTNSNISNCFIRCEGDGATNIVNGGHNNLSNNTIILSGKSNISHYTDQSPDDAGGSFTGNYVRHAGTRLHFSTITGNTFFHYDNTETEKLLLGRPTLIMGNVFDGGKEYIDCNDYKQIFVYNGYSGNSPLLSNIVTGYVSTGWYSVR